MTLEEMELLAEESLGRMERATELGLATIEGLSILSPEGFLEVLAEARS